MKQSNTYYVLQFAAGVPSEQIWTYFSRFYGGVAIIEYADKFDLEQAQVMVKQHAASGYVFRIIRVDCTYTSVD